MISQIEVQKLISANGKELDIMNDELFNNPSLLNLPYPPAGDPEFKYSHQLTRLVAEKNLLRKINGQLP
jgi:hypothetical protein